MKESKRKLTEREKLRIENAERVTIHMKEQGYIREDVTIGIVFANIMAVILSVPVIFLFGWLFLQRNIEYVQYTLEISGGKVLFLIIAGTVVHELIHGAVWGIFAEKHFQSIDFGFIAEYLTPYCTCTVPLKMRDYLLGGIMPGLILGIIPMTISVFWGTKLLFFFGAIMIVGAGGDFTIALKMLWTKHKRKGELVCLDHPTEGGFILFRKE